MTATAGDSQATVSWTASGAEGSTVTGYTVSDGSGDTCTTDGTGTSCIVTGLTNGQSYTFTVVATNGDGPGATSAPSNAVTPSTVPDAPTGVTATAGDHSATVSWTGSADEGAAITGYTVSDGSGDTCTTSGTSCIVTGLTNGESYTFTVVATNADGTGAASPASNTVTPSTVPDAPTAVTATAGNGQATVTWTAPSDEGSTITGYVVRSARGVTCTTTTTSCVVTGLLNGMSTTFTVVATNADGSGAASAPSNAVIPSSNTATITSANSVTVAAGKPLKFKITTSGSPVPSVAEAGITAPWLIFTPGSKGAAGTAELTGTGPASGGTYTFTVEANNGVGPNTTQAFTVHVLAITSSAAATFVPGTEHSVTITTAGVPSGVTLSAALSGKLKGLTFTDDGDGTATLSGSAATTDRTAVVTVTARSGSVTATQKLTVTIG